jgi:Cu-Zn family superoxide dismutase
MKHSSGTAFCLMMMATAIALPALAADLTVTMRKATQDGTGYALGTVTITADATTGTSFKLNLRGLPPGPHGFHVHENANCSPTMLFGVRIPAGAAGDHLDPDNTGVHQGSMGQGHLGDLPVLVVEADGTAKRTLVAPRIKNTDILKGHALIIHLGGDDYSDSPARGGGGGRFACSLVE